MPSEPAIPADYDADELLRFWFADSVRPGAALDRYERRWFQADPTLDATIRDRYVRLIQKGAAGELEDWTSAPRGRLALIVLLDQFPRNAFRGRAEAYAFDARARAICREGIIAGADRALAPIERLFFYLPLMHAEAASDQQQSVACFADLAAGAEPGCTRFFAGWSRRARRQRMIVALFGRFPHRNAPLGRASHIIERLYLAGCAALGK